MAEQQFQKREVAYKVRISDILDSQFHKDDASAGHIKFNGNTISRVNIIANLVSKSEESQYSNGILDDGTGKILLRTFEPTQMFSQLDVGDFVLLVGKVREFNNEKYIIPEALKKIEDFGWVNLRKLELGNLLNVEKVEAKEVVEDDGITTRDKICDLIKKIDSGDGAAFDDILNSANDKDAEKIINRLLENGDIFEVRPGKLKVLE
jgi:uncharacterized protein